MRRIREPGVVTKWWHDQGFGFIEPMPPDGQTLFIHITDVTGGPNVCVGDELEFERIATSKGPRAVKAIIIESREVVLSESEADLPR